MIYASTGEGSIIAFSNEDEVTPTDKKLRTTVKLKSGKEVRKHDERIYPPPRSNTHAPQFLIQFSPQDERYYDEPLQRFGTKQAKGSDEDERRAHEGRVYDITVTHDGKFLISVSEDKFIKVWSLQDPENPPGTPDQVFVQGDKIYSTGESDNSSIKNVTPSNSPKTPSQTRFLQRRTKIKAPLGGSLPLS